MDGTCQNRLFFTLLPFYLLLSFQVATAERKYQKAVSFSFHVSWYTAVL